MQLAYMQLDFICHQATMNIIIMYCIYNDSNKIIWCAWVDQQIIIWQFITSIDNYNKAIYMYIRLYTCTVSSVVF